MKLIPFLLAAALVLTTAAAEPVKIIFDTDITGDVDDVLALAMCHTLADRGACELLTAVQQARALEAIVQPPRASRD